MQGNVKQIICMPRAENIPEPHDSWELTKCPVCGCDCYLMPEAMLVLALGGGNYAAYCTLCALKAGVNRK